MDNATIVSQDDDITLSHIMAKLSALVTVVDNQSRQISQLQQGNNHNTHHDTYVQLPKNVFHPTEFFRCLSMPGKIFQVIALHNTVRNGLWYQCYVLHIPNFSSVQVKELKYSSKQSVVWTGKKVDIQHGQSLRPVLVSTRLNHFRSVMLTGESGKFYMVGYQKDSENNPNPKVYKIEPGEDMDTCISAGETIHLPPPPSMSRSEAFQRGRVVFFRSLTEHMNKLKLDQPNTFMPISFRIDMDESAWQESIYRPLLDYAIPHCKVETLESHAIFDGLMERKQVVTIKAQQVQSDKQQHVDILKSILGVNSFTRYRSESEYVTVVHRHGEGFRFTYYPPPLSFIHVKLNMHHIKTGMHSRSVTPPRSSQSVYSYDTTTVNDTAGLLATARVTPSDATTNATPTSNRPNFIQLNAPTRHKWTKEEHKIFIKGLRLHGKGAWVLIAEEVGTKNASQVKQHATKYFRKLENTNNGP